MCSRWVEASELGPREDEELPRAVQIALGADGGQKRKRSAAAVRVWCHHLKQPLVNAVVP